MKKERIAIDTFFQLKATTGIRTYTNELILSLKEESDYHIVEIPRLRYTEALKLFKHNDSKLVKGLWQMVYLLHKVLFLPLACRLMGCKKVICPDYIGPIIGLGIQKFPVVHSNFIWETPENYNQKWLKYYKALLKYSLRGDSHVITTSKYTKESIRKYIPKEVSISVAYQSSERLNLGLASTSFHARYGEDFILHVGYFDRRKNIVLLIRAYAKLLKLNPSVGKLVLAGHKGASAFDDDSARIQQVILELGLGENVIIPGYVSDQELIYLYSNAIFYVFPSLNEGFGIPSLEAFSYKLPLIISDAGALVEVAGSAALVFRKSDYMDLAQKMEQLVGNRELRETLIIEGTKRLREFSRSNFAEMVTSALKR